MYEKYIFMKKKEFKIRGGIKTPLSKVPFFLADIIFLIVNK